MTTEPRTVGFEYTVRIAVALPAKWTELLKRVSASHYDYKCREAGECGVINGLHNTRIEDGAPASTFPLSWRDLDLIAKVMEQAHYHTDDWDLIRRIRNWIRAAKDRITDRHNKIDALP